MAEASDSQPVPRLVAFDLDDTLAPSKSPLPQRMAEALRQLLDCTQVAVISGGALPQFQLQLLENLGANPEQLNQLHLMPTCGTRYCRFEGGQLVDVYNHPLPESTRRRVKDALEAAARGLGLWVENPWGEVIEDRGSQITFSALGQAAPLDAKRAWDPDGKKRAALVDEVSASVPDLEVRSGGSTSVDVTQRGIDKAYGMARLEQATGLGRADVLFIGDRLDEGGNDYPVKAAGWRTQAVSDWEDTASYLEALLA